MINNAKHLPMCLLTICMSSLEKNIYSDLMPIFYIWLFIFFDVELHELFTYFGYQLLTSQIICKYLLPFSSCLFISLMVSFAVLKLLSLIRSLLFIFGFISFALGDRSPNILLRFMSKSVLPMFSSRSFMVLVLHVGL